MAFATVKMAEIYLQSQTVASIGFVKLRLQNRTAKPKGATPLTPIIRRGKYERKEQINQHSCNGG